MSSLKVIKKIEDDGWVLKRINGSHHHFKHPTKSGLVTVPHPQKDIPIKTLNRILQQAGLSK
ncbi:type II toxin-antitoxin system HicA family toxin [Lysinibacillus sp. FSL L8-0312]|uniref:type II toxin-antitoxin system HicA family toxin n=1 Tax=unclassified Lysinibacillus TaxID=2636778 RepID=UPI00232CBDA6|nr:type II toxin-antitoxin system HicA family toxin [Lysinibacillus sp. OF-1]WCH49680.1 type II toxin-antitoxin system HicA family toxin [Lysinibacillus sp. OF-1]